uniref:Methyltransferase 22, Kin17 lysine n=1 Tax=Sander lucioperca TaxID=283035 RepID=A0A8D0DGF3_SANLU
MDHITFHHDTVLSDVHMLLPNARHLMTRLNAVGQPGAYRSIFSLTPWSKRDVDRFVRKCNHVKHTESVRDTSTSGRDLVCPIIIQQSNPVLEEEEDNTEDEDDKSFNDIIKIESCVSCSPQVWRGAFLMADFILSEPLMFRGATVLELGAGTGLTSIVMATVAKTVYCTDVGEDLLGMCKRNVTLNRHMIEPAGEITNMRYDDVEFRWTEEEVADMYNNTNIIIAADVCYDDDLTDGFFRTLYRLCSNFTHTCTVFISIEKRMNFTLRHMDVSCDAYNHFRHCLSQLQDLEDGRCSFRVQQLPSTCAQFLLYERIEQLVKGKPSHTSNTFNLKPS